jgi:hypothetical protein
MNKKPLEKSFIASWKKGFCLHYIFMFFPFFSYFHAYVTQLLSPILAHNIIQLFFHVFMFALFNRFFLLLCLCYSIVLSCSYACVIYVTLFCFCLLHCCFGASCCFVDVLCIHLLHCSHVLHLFSCFFYF